MDSLEGLERLARLRAQGLLTDEEFAAEKARLLRSTTSTSNSHADATVDQAATSSRGGTRWFWPAGLLTLSVAGVAGWQLLESGGQSSAPSILPAIPGIAQAKASEWQFSRSSDPMTDEKVLQAARTIQLDNFQIDASIACRPSAGQVSYTFTTFMSDGKAAPARPFPYLQQLEHHATVRRDRSAAERFESGSSYSNQFVIKETEKGFQAAKDEGFRVGYLPTAQHLTVQLALMNGDPVFEIDQTDGNVARVLAACTGSETNQAASPSDQVPQGIQPMVAGEPKTIYFDIDDNTLAGSSDGRLLQDRITSVCVGDTILIRNQSGQVITVLGSKRRGDEAIDLNNIQAGENFSYETELEGPWFLTVQGHPSARFAYEAEQCS